MNRRKRPARRPDRRRGFFERLENRLPLAADITTGLVHYWTFDETSGNIASDSAGESDGTLVNWSPTEAKWEPGRVGGALRFGTADNHVIAPNPGMTGSFSISFWLNATSRSGRFARIVTPKAGNVVFLANELGRGLSYTQNDDFFTYSPDPPAFNTWEHYAINFNNATGQGVIYRSGAPVGIGAFADSASAVSWVIGHSYDLNNGDHSLHGALDDFRVFNRVLTDEDIAALASLGSPAPVHEEPIHHWKFDETTGFTAHDSAGDADATLLNWSQSEPRWEAGKIGGAVRITTTDNAIVTAPASTGPQWSIAFWANLKSGDRYPRVIGPSDGRELWSFFDIENNRGLGFQSRSVSTSDPSPVEFDVWSHYAITFDTLADIGTIYRDGVQVASGPFWDNATEQQLVIGHTSDLGNHEHTLLGLLDDLRVYDRLLSSNEIAGLAAEIDTGLVHHWTFDEISGDIAADIAGDADATLVNWNATEPKWEPGRVGGALRFDTADNYVIAQPPAMPGSYAVSFWLNVEDRSGVNPRIFNARAGNEIALNYDSGRGVGFYSATREAHADPNPPTFSFWEHYVLNFNAATNQGVVYRGGAPVAIGAFFESASLSTWVFGHHDNLGHHGDSLRGALDDLRVYNRLLTDEDIAALSEMGVPELAHPEPVHHWTFDETTGFTARDIAGGADGILLNWTPTEPRWEPGKVGGALRFSTVDNAVVTSSITTGAQWTNAFWLKLEARTGINPRILEPWAYINQEANQGVGFTSRNTHTFDPAPVALDTWEHYAITYDTILDVGTIYRNGVAVQSGFFGDNSPASPWVFGHQSGDLGNHGDSLDGLLDDFRHYDRLLSPSEIQQLAQVAVNDAYETNEDMLLDVAAAQGVLVNDTNHPAGAVLTLETNALHGEVDLNDDGSFTYDPDENYNGLDSFAYRLANPGGGFALATVALTIKPVNDVPTFLVGADRFVDDEAGSRGITHWASQVTAGPPDEANQTLTFEAIADKPELLAVQPKVEVVDGTLPGLWGRLTYTLARNKTGVVTVTIRLKDNGGADEGGIDTTATQTFKINIAKAHPGHNAIIGMDVDDDGAIAAGDALAVVNYINAFGSTAVPPETGAVPPYHDVTSDGMIAADDALTVINYLNASQPGSATFVGTDTTTQGNWQALYGTAGYVLNSGAANPPDYAQLSTTSSYNVTWAATTSDSRALQKPASADRFAAAWTGQNPEVPHLLNGFVMDLNLTDGLQHRVAIYILDWDTTNRTQRMEVLDANTGQVLDTQLSGPFHDGKYLVWMLKGHVKIRFTNLANGLNAVASGVFFD